MRRLTYLAAAAAATGALALIPLAAQASSASAASPAPASQNAAAFVGNVNWAGYVATLPPSYEIASQFGWIQASFTLPKTSCSDSTESGKAIPKGDLYSGTAFWVGLGGVNNKRLEQAGILPFCASKTSAAQFQAFWEMVPKDSGIQPVALYNAKGKGVTIHAGDKITASITDDSTGTSYKPGQEYRAVITDATQGAKSNIALLSFGKNALGSDNTAEVVTEVLSSNAATNKSGPWNPPLYTGIAHFQPVTYTGIEMGFNGGGYAYGIGQAFSWTTAAWRAAGGPIDHLLINTGPLTNGVGGEAIGIAFTTYWEKY